MTLVDTAESIRVKSAGLRGELPHGFEALFSKDHYVKRFHDIHSVGRHQAEAEVLRQNGGGLLSGACKACDKNSNFVFEPLPDNDPRDVSKIDYNWRESLRCECCGLISRVRSACELLGGLLRKERADLYLTEALGPLKSLLDKRYKSVIGSEYISPDKEPGSTHLIGGQVVFHEDVTNLSLSAGSVDAVVSLEVLEHVPDYRSALSEFSRVIKKEAGVLLVTAPLALGSESTVVRARKEPDGSITHFEPPDYHGDPLSLEGVLCYYNFGWDILNTLREVGFSEAAIVQCWDLEKGYLGRGNQLIVATR